MQYASLNFHFDREMQVWNRQTYSVLDFLGDLGGLYDALRLICSILVVPISAISLKVSIMTSLFTKLVKSEDQSIEPLNCLKLNLVGYFYRRSETRRYKRFLEDAHTKVNQELDLEVFLRTQMTLQTALSVLFTKR